LQVPLKPEVRIPHTGLLLLAQNLGVSLVYSGFSLLLIGSRVVFFMSH